MFKKNIALLSLVFLSLILSSCYVAGGENADFPRHRYKTIEQVKEQIPFDILMPNLKSKELQKCNFKFFTVNLPGPVVTGYSIEIDNSTNDSIFKKAELRGIKTSIKGVQSEGFTDNYYNCIIKETPIKISGKDCFYSAFADKVFTQNEISKQKGIGVNSSETFKNNQNIKYFYIYTKSDEIRYSVTFSEFRDDSFSKNGSLNKEIKDECLNKAGIYLKTE